MRLFIAVLLSCLSLGGVATAQTRRADPAVTEILADESGEGSGAAIEGRAYDPRANTATQPERNGGDEDEVDQNEGDDGNNGTGGN